MTPNDANGDRQLAASLRRDMQPASGESRNSSPPRLSRGTRSQMGRIERVWWPALVGTMAGIFGISAGQHVPGPSDQGLWALVSGGPGGAPWSGHLSTTRDRPALPVHVSPVGRSDARLVKPARPVGIAARPSGGELGGMGALHLLSVWLAVAVGHRDILWL